MTREHPVTGRGLLWVLGDLACQVGIEVACEFGLRRCREGCLRHRQLQKDIQFQRDWGWLAPRFRKP